VAATCPWQWFITLTFLWDVRSETADAKLKEWLNLVERTLRTRVCFVAGKERKPHSYGMEVPWHFHILAMSLAAMPKGLLEESWRTLMSPAARRLLEAEAVNDSIAAEDDPVDDSVVVEPYKHNRQGPEYCLKSLNTYDGDWCFRWLELFNPPIRPTSFPNQSKSRSRMRFEAQQGESRAV
jgi:hypothetical protein